ncbi:MAG: phage tail tube protein [Vicinamibacteria bacterium]
MATLDHQLGTVDEVTYGTLITPTRFHEYNSESIEETEGRTEGDPLRAGTFVQRNDRFTPYFSGAGGPIQVDVLSKGFGFWLKHMLGSVATTGPAETTVFTHTGTVGSLMGDSFTAQVNRPFSPSGTNQPFAYLGGKVAQWSLSNAVDGNLICDLTCDFQNVDTATGLAVAAYPTAMEPLTWVGGVINIGGLAYDITEISVSGDNSINGDRRQIRGNSLKKEPTNGRRAIEFSINADFDSMAQRNRAHATTRAAALASITATWTAPTLIGSTLFPALTLTIPAARFDKWKAATEGPDALMQELSGVVRYDGTNSPVSVAYQTLDTTP